MKLDPLNQILEEVFDTSPFRYSVQVLLIGDFMIDHYIIGTSDRISPEAPVPVVIPEKEYSIPGGAGNVAINLCRMGADVICVGVVGADSWGKKLLSILENEGINIENIEIIDNHPTTVKHRVYSDGKQVARIDIEKRIDWNPPYKIKKNVDQNGPNILIESDYNKGVLSLQENPDLGIAGGAHDDDKVYLGDVIVDPKKDDFIYYKNADIITPNLNELQKASKIELHNDNSIVDACNILIEKYNFNYIVTKKGDKGMTVVGKDNFVKHIKAHHVENPDVTGAGDTVVAALSLAFHLTKDIEISAKFANAAAAVVVGKPGTATATLDEIKELLVE